MRTIGLLAGVAILAVGLSACQHESNNTIYMPDMFWQPSIKAQSEGSMRMPVKGTVPRGYQPFAYMTNGPAAGQAMQNPLRRTKDVLLRGQTVFNTYCMTCHGPAGEGDGSIVPKFPRPPTLQSEKIRAWKDGEFFHIITAGRNLMPSYASQITPGDRWAAIHYIRVLHRAKNPTDEDLKRAAQESE